MTIGPPICVVVWPEGVVTLIMFASLALLRHSMRYPGGKKVLNPDMRVGCPLNRVDTRSMTPGVSILHEHRRELVTRYFYTVSRSLKATAKGVGGGGSHSHSRTTYFWLLKSFIISRKRL